MNDPQRRCEDHHPRQHRDGREPWCRTCGLTADFRRPRDRFNRAQGPDFGTFDKGLDIEPFHKAVAAAVAKIQERADLAAEFYSPLSAEPASATAWRELHEEIDRHNREVSRRRLEYREELCRQMVEDGERGILLFDYIEPTKADDRGIWSSEWVLQGQLSELVPYGQIYEVRSNPETFIENHGLQRLMERRDG